MLPRYPVYIPSKNRSDKCHTAKFLSEDKVPFYLVIEPQEYDAYASKFGRDQLLVLPFSNEGLISARNWIKDHSTQAGFERHWQLDDNIYRIQRLYKGNRIRCEAGIALSVTEDFVDRYENIAIAGLNYTMFAPPSVKSPPFYLNHHVYSCSLILNSISNKWRTQYNDDTDMCLQVLADGWCTVLINVFLIKKIRTMLIKGGNTSDLYQGDGRLKMSRSLERLWPNVVKTSRRFKRPQHLVRNAWMKFDTPLKLKEGINLSQMKQNEYGMELILLRELKSKTLGNLISK